MNKMILKGVFEDNSDGMEQYEMSLRVDSGKNHEVYMPSEQIETGCTRTVITTREGFPV